MKKVSFLGMLLLLGLCSCEKAFHQEGDDETKTIGAQTEFVEGTYSGTFTRTAGSGANTATSNVFLSFTDGKFSGTSSLNYYPAICSGTFSANKGKINVQNSCAFTANFDWTFIFTGQYQYEQKGTELVIWRDYGNNTKDIYTLKSN